MKTILLSVFARTVKFLAVYAFTSYGLSVKAQLSGGGNGLNFETFTLQSGTALQVGAKYLFTKVDNTTDAIVSIDSLVNGAKVNKIDDNSNGTGYKQAFQPAIQSGSVEGYSYAVFTIKFYEHGTTTPKALHTVNATGIDIDGNNTLKEFVRIYIGSGGSTSYMMASPDISVTQITSGDFLGQNVLGIERNGIDTSALNNMYTTSNNNISSFVIKAGTFTTLPSSAVRQFSVYMKWFAYPPSTLPVKLASFTATLNNNKADLKWTTSSEINVNHFVIERSFDGINYSDAGIMFAYGSETQKANYQFPDNLAAVSASVVYYRLRSVDHDGKTELSEVRIVRLASQKVNDIVILTYPNPVTTELRITIPSNWQNKPVVFEIYNANGQSVKRIQTGSSSQTETINIAELAKGLYIVKAVCEGNTAQQKIIKQ